MIASTRGLAILAGIAVLLLALVLIVGSRSPHPVDRALVPGFTGEQLTAVSWSSGQQIKRAGTRWIDNEGGVVEPAAVDAIATALRGGRWHRRTRAMTAPARTVTIAGTTLGLGRRLPGTDQVWLVRDGEELLVDSWVGSALFPEPIELRVRTPLDCASATSITATTDAGGVRVEGRRLVEPHPSWLDQRWLDSLSDACANLRFVALESGQRTRPGLHIVVTGAGSAELTEVGTCSQGRVLVDSTVGSGCVTADSVHALHDALNELIETAHEPIDQRPLPFAPATITLADGTTLQVTGTPRVGANAADPDRVRELVAALTAPGEAVVERPRAKPAARIVAVEAAHGRGTPAAEVTLELVADRVIARAGEAGAIRVHPRDWAVITRPTAALRDATRWHEDATTISSLSLDGVTYKRGAVLGEWTREPAGKLDTALVEALVETLTSVRAPADAPPASVAHHLKLTITPPAGPPTTHTIDFAPPTAIGCPGRVDNAPALVPLPLCTAALALAAQR